MGIGIVSTPVWSSDGKYLYFDNVGGEHPGYRRGPRRRDALRVFSRVEGVASFVVEWYHSRRFAHFQPGH